MRPYFVFLFIFFSGFLFSQNNFLIDETTWFHRHTHAILDASGTEYVVTEIVKINGDTILAGKEYKKLFMGIDSLNLRYRAGMREDSGKVYAKWRFRFDTSEQLLFDYTLLPGAIFREGFYTHFPDTVPVLKQIYLRNIDSLTLSDGSQRKRLNFFRRNHENRDSIQLLEGNAAFTWIEGIGDPKCFYDNEECYNLGWDPIGGWFFPLTCYFQNNQVLYKNPAYQECYLSNYTSSTNDNDKKLKILVYPNPSKATTNFSHPELFRYELLRIFDPSGKIVFERKIEKNEKEISWKNDSEYSGIYFYQLYSESLSQVTGKIIIE